MTEVKPLHLDTPQQAEAAFYAAFEAADLAAMMQVWDDAADICCIHPMGRALTGPLEVSRGWAGIFAAGPTLRFTLEPVSFRIQGELAVSVVFEHIRVAGEARPRPPMLATNVYRRGTTGWRLWLHHASPAVVTLDNALGAGALVH
ncbi:MAG: nuclear transport factor 2 family protein [Thiobacillaceae bacterium]|nr:nuclear transport factor 2 family protein [Thiobacillaceae bacterium]MCX7672764.1 nuclear transport factor 2 family protein [Thiobacillaceae bacterium]MDW8323218.1 nuclear transport factor 2 family protein [Burkholderiales bacterium]